MIIILVNTEVMQIKLLNLMLKIPEEIPYGFSQWIELWLSFYHKRASKRV